jgi:hypothetical protein
LRASPYLTTPSLHASRTLLAPPPLISAAGWISPRLRLQVRRRPSTNAISSLRERRITEMDAEAGEAGRQRSPAAPFVRSSSRLGAAQSFDGALRVEPVLFPPTVLPNRAAWRACL